MVESEALVNVSKLIFLPWVLIFMFCSSLKIYFCLILPRFCRGCNGEFAGVGIHIPGSATRALPEVMSMDGSAMVFS